MNIDNTNLSQIRRLGIEILNRELGPVAMIRFFQQYEKGYGNYSTERHEWIDKISIEEIVEDAKKLRENNIDTQDH
ncbi:MAG: hypothetical protein GF353_14825 [Candidatus Lokiarchaeota archaeon]|nr:hypothetical protein [Candidatus Lokiarchaeota archaeon]